MCSSATLRLTMAGAAHHRPCRGPPQGAQWSALPRRAQCAQRADFRLAPRPRTGARLMTVFPNRVVAVLLLTALSANVIVRGIVPETTRITSDFPSYFTAASVVADRGNVERLYDIPWFQEQMRRYQVGTTEGKFSPFPPPTALLLVPLTPLSPLDALRVLTGVSVVCLIGSIVLLARSLAWSTLDAAV